MTSYEAPVRTVSLDADGRYHIRAEARATLEQTARYVLSTADHERTDRLWPADAMVFATNPMSLAYGACGPALFLQHSSTPYELPTKTLTWLLNMPLDVDTYPPGLYSGLAGVACTFAELGIPEKALETMKLAYQSPLLFEEANVMVGCAGWGMAGLHLYQLMGDQILLDHSVDAGNHLLNTACYEGDTYNWGPNSDGRIPYGFGYGATGCALFLLQLYSVTGETRFRDAAVRSVNHDLARRLDGPLGWQFQSHDGDTLVKPYWISGAAGIGSTLVRFHRALGDEQFLADARHIAYDSSVKFTVEPGLFQGLAGIAEFMIDLYIHTNEAIYHDTALDIADTIMWFRINRPEGTAWPGRWLRRISDDYATGAAGIGLLLNRLLHPGPRLLLDLLP
ncbi:lanthionine synthetase C family protein [Streptomyces nigrescens]|uniref:lanthionine synthetase C family protein n=1 Tax=Streptomyces nigrescens TaxID=1920 RepID=UPI002259A673|nr:lanthionine synthetase C family protein [Streptomyces libani]MCX5449506.1 lanthionine synthetase C family protein [Streptomyces libani]